ncbi:DNA mismatch repair protein Msh2 isoform X2 [Harmonia axyridis]|uniref:DNA mismatch repair protein Msh2 isoform X2 n=1 Tax=Harmonia axyridis TaxID=115357 RepID=UPI001E2793B6|nr:DNA mismatch repair protein Msh2 isoform X2 [Harmonia axyridis]
MQFFESTVHGYKSSTTIRFFNRTDFYTVHGNDALVVSQINGSTVKYMGEEPKLRYVTLSKSQFELVLRELLLVRQYRVEVYLKQTQGRNNDWQVEYKGSPGNLSQFEEILFENADIVYSNSVMGIKIVKNRVLALGCVNVAESKFNVCEIVDNDCFTELEALIAQISPKECIIPDTENNDYTSLKNLLERNGVLVARVKKSDFNSSEVMEDLNRLLYFQKGQTRNALTFSETQLNEAMGSLQALIKFLNLPGDERNFNQYKFETLDMSRFVRLDNAALQALNVFPQAGTSTVEDSVLVPNSSKSSSLMGVLNFCSTNQGKRLLSQWIKQPLRDYNLINDRLNVVDCFIKNMETRVSLTKDCLPRLPDTLLLVKKLSSKKASLQDCYRIYQTISGVPHLLKNLRETGNKHVKSMLIDPISEILFDLQKYLEMIEQVLDLDLVDRGEFLVKHTFDDQLKDLYREKQKYEEKMQKLLRRAIDDLGLEDGRVKLECTDQHGYFFRVTLKEEHVLRGNKQYSIIDAIKGGVRFTNDKLSEINEDYRGLKENYEQVQKAVVEQILDIAAGYSETLRNLNILIATVDVLTSFSVAAVSAKIPYVRPKLHETNSGILSLKKVRHPCLEHQDHISFIPNSATFDKENNTLHIITGPNMCGKSTFIRSVGVCVLMAHIGCYVPCESAEISVVDSILARVGADDCQLKGLSTFMLEMIETSTIVKTATSNSLVIIDELGRGTSTYDGCGIASAIVEYLANEVKCFSLFATHFHEIISLAEKFSNVTNWHVTAATTNNTITPLYQVRQGPCDKSYGIHCARMVGFPEDVLQWAEEYQKELEHFEGTKLIADYEDSLKREVIESGDKIIQQTLKDVVALSVNSLSDENLCQRLKNIKEEILKEDNKFLKGLLCE